MLAIPTMSTQAQVNILKPVLKWPIAAWLQPFWYAYLACAWWWVAAAELAALPARAHPEA